MSYELQCQKDQGHHINRPDSKPGLDDKAYSRFIINIAISSVCYVKSDKSLV